ncbi:MAG: MFS transporter [Succinivibrio sp.]|nr:MFS transporter [Succinivibrio sp.]
MKNTKRNYILLIAVSACLIYAVSSGIRSNLAILLNSLVEHSGQSYAAVSFALAAGQLVYGLVQPLFGIIVIKKSNLTALSCGVILMAIGLAVTPWCHSELTLLLFPGIIFHAGTGATCFGIVMSVATPALGRYHAAVVSGLINAGTGLGSTFLAPLMSLLNNTVGVDITMLCLLVPVMLIMPVCVWLSHRKNIMMQSHPDDGVEKTSMWQAVNSALKDRDFIILVVSFSICGFHMAILQTHMYAQLISYGISEPIATLCYTLMGIATMCGALLCGLCCLKFEIKNVLGSVYVLRGVIGILFVFVLPKNSITVIVVAIMLGLTTDASVSPTCALICNKYGPKLMAILFGFTYMCHQIGSFLSAAFGGMSLTTTGNYNLLWTADILLCLLAAALVYAIRIKTELIKEKSKSSYTTSKPTAAA